MIVTKRLKVPFRKAVDVFRCNTCGRIGLETQSSLKSHAGHQMKQPCNVSLMEYLGMMIGVIK